MRTLYSVLKRISCALGASLLLIGFAGAQDDQHPNVVIKGYPVRLTLLNRDRDNKPWPDEKPDVLVTPHKVKRGDTIHTLLISNNVRPDLEAFILVYELNPDTTDLNKLVIGKELVLPKVNVGPKLRRDLQSGFRVALTVDPELKDQFANNVEELATLFPKNFQLKSNQIDEGLSADSTNKAIIYVVERLKFMQSSLIRRNGKPLTKETIEQLNAEAETMKSILTPVLKSERKLTPEEASQIAAIQKDIEIKAAQFVQVASGTAPAASLKVKVIVKTLKDGKEIPGLSIYYVPVALKHRTALIRSFDGVSSPCERQLPEADYLVWAAKPGTMARLSEEKAVEVRQSATGVVVLTISK